MPRREGSPAAWRQPVPPKGGTQKGVSDVWVAEHTLEALKGRGLEGDIRALSLAWPCTGVMQNSKPCRLRQIEAASQPPKAAAKKMASKESMRCPPPNKP